MKPKNKSFDCVEMKRQIQEQPYEDAKGMNFEQLAAYYHNRIANSRFADFLDRPVVGAPRAAQQD